jgi:alpha-1,3-glucosyltransferase
MHVSGAECSTAVTLAGFLPSGAHLLLCAWRGSESPRRFLLALYISALCFFLFSYQGAHARWPSPIRCQRPTKVAGGAVHEKSVLLPLLPATMLYLDWPEEVTFLTLVGTFSMFPLLRRDALVLPYGVLMVVVHALCTRTSSDRTVSFLAPRRLAKLVHLISLSLLLSLLYRRIFPH